MKDNNNKKCATTRIGDTMIVSVCVDNLYVGRWICSWLPLDFLFRYFTVWCEKVYLYVKLILCIHMRLKQHVTFEWWTISVGFFFNYLYDSPSWIFPFAVQFNQNFIYYAFGLHQHNYTSIRSRVLRLNHVKKYAQTEMIWNLCFRCHMLKFVDPWDFSLKAHVHAMKCMNLSPSTSFLLILGNFLFYTWGSSRSLYKCRILSHTNTLTIISNTITIITKETVVHVVWTKIEIL